MSWNHSTDGDLSALREYVDEISRDTTAGRIRQNKLTDDLDRLENVAGELAIALDKQDKGAEKIEELDRDLNDAREALDNVTFCLKELSKNEALWEGIVKALPERANDLARFLDSGVLNYAVEMPKPNK